MFKKFITTIALLAVFAMASGEGTDTRQLVEMPEGTRYLMRLEMLDHLTTLNGIISLIASENLQSVAELAENKLGKSSMGKHRGNGMGPGRFMPLEMRNIGWSMHEAASELAQYAAQNDLKNTLNTLQKVTGSCMACHNSFRTR